MTRKYQKPGQHQQFTISAENGSLTGKPTKKKAIKQFTDGEREEFEIQRAEAESTWSKIDRTTIDRQCEQREVWDE